MFSSKIKNRLLVLRKRSGIPTLTFQSLNVSSSSSSSKRLAPPPTPPKPPQKPLNFAIHGHTWTDPYHWMCHIRDKEAMRHMNAHLELEAKYTDAVMADTKRMQRKLQSEMAVRMTAELSTPPVQWGPWLYYRRVDEGKEYPILCRRLASLNDEFVSFKCPSAGFDFKSGQKIEQKLLDYNLEAERFSEFPGFAIEESSEVSPDHRFLAYTMFDINKDFFVLNIKDLNMGTLVNCPNTDRVANLAWGMDGKALFYTVTDSTKRPYRLYCHMLEPGKGDFLILEELDNDASLNIRSTKDFKFVTVNTFSSTSSKVHLIDAASPLSSMMLIWQGEPFAHCIIEHHQGILYLFTDASIEGSTTDFHHLFRSPVTLFNASYNPATWKAVFSFEPHMSLLDVEVCNSHMVLVLMEGQKLRICSVHLPLPVEHAMAHLTAFHPVWLPLPSHVCQISPGSNYDFYSSLMRFTISSPVMPDAVVDYNLSTGEGNIIQQQDILTERSRILYGTSFPEQIKFKKLSSSGEADNMAPLWNDLSEYYACEHFNVRSKDEVDVPLTVVYSRKHKEPGQNPGLLHGHGAYGEVLDKRWRSEIKSLLDRGWVIAYADVRGGGGRGKKWHHEGRCLKKLNSVHDYVSCAQFLIDKGIVHEKKLACWGYSVGGLLVAAAINLKPDLFRAAILKVPFLDVFNTLWFPVIPLTPADYAEFGYPADPEQFRAVREFSPYENIGKDCFYPSILISSSLRMRFGVWEAAKWVARIRDQTIADPKRPVLLNFTSDVVEENRYLLCKEAALETAFLIKTMQD